MRNHFLNILGTMSGTSLDGIDLSVIKSNGTSLKRLNKNYFFEYSEECRKKIIRLIDKISLNSQKPEDINEIDDLITKEYIKAIGESGFVKFIDIIGFHGQTILHDQQKIKYQIGNKKISNYFNKNIIYNFRQNDLNFVEKVHL